VLRRFVVFGAVRETGGAERGSMSQKIRVLVVGCGHMGSSHARAYHKMDGFEIAGVVSRGPKTRGRLSRELGGLAEYDDFRKALEATRPDAVSINTYPDTHAEYARRSLERGAHVFVEKPLAQTVDKPLVMRMNLNQQSSGYEWETHKQLMGALSPIVDCGVHYVDIMCHMTQARPVRVQAIGARLTGEIEANMYNYGQLQVVFDDDSIGWYEAGWGPMMSETAYFVKDVIGPRGCVSIVSPGDAASSSDIDNHTKTNRLRLHYSERDARGNFVREDEIIDMSDEPGHQELCDREQAYFLRAIREDLDLTDHLEDAVNSLRIVLAADESVRTGGVVLL